MPCPVCERDHCRNLQCRQIKQTAQRAYNTAFAANEIRLDYWAKKDKDRDTGSMLESIAKVLKLERIKDETIKRSGNLEHKVRRTYHKMQDANPLARA